MQGPYAEHLLDASDVCSNCLRRTRVERIDPYLSDELEAESKYSRHEQRTEVGYGPHESPPKSKGVFCKCGVESTFVRTWDDGVGYQRFKQLVKNTIRTLKEKDVTFYSRGLMEHAYAGFRERLDEDGALLPVMDASDVDEILADAIEQSITVTIASERRQSETQA
jgi:hypothetical protein